MQQVCDLETVRALERMSQEDPNGFSSDVLALINRLRLENGKLEAQYKLATARADQAEAKVDELEYTLLGVMHSVDKWLTGDELNQDEVNRAVTMREKTLRIIETAQSAVAREFVERLKEKVCVFAGKGDKEYMRGLEEAIDWYDEKVQETLREMTDCASRNSD